MILCTWAGFANTPNDSALCASWVQAVGSIAAVLIAVAVAAFQHWQSARERREAEADIDRRALAAPRALAQRLKGELMGLYMVVRLAGADRDSMGQGYRAALHTASVELQQARADYVIFDALPIQGLPTYEAIHCARKLSALFSEMLDHLEHLLHYQSFLTVEGMMEIEEHDGRAARLLERMDTYVKRLLSDSALME